MASFVLRVRMRDGTVKLSTLQACSTIASLKGELSQITNIASNHLRVLHGFPPKRLDLTLEDQTLEASGIHTGDTLIIQENVPPVVEVPSKPSSSKAEDIKQHILERLLPHPGILLKKRVVPADNSCLFTSIGFVLKGEIDVTCGSFLRKIIADGVARDYMEFSEAILGRPNHEYCKWILRPDSWGGAIELAVLSKYYGIEIAVVDTLNGIINRFGEDRNYEKRVFLMFDGIHYDGLYVEPVQVGETIRTVFLSSDDNVLRQAENLAIEGKMSHQFTDVNKFSLKCLDCNTFLVGQSEALAHAKETSHNNFGEVTR